MVGERSQQMVVINSIRHFGISVQSYPAWHKLHSIIFFCKLVPKGNWHREYSSNYFEILLTNIRPV